MHIAESVAKEKGVLRNVLLTDGGDGFLRVKEICPLDVVIVWPMSV